MSAIGTNAEENLHALQQATTGIGEVRYLSTGHREYPVGEVKMSNGEMCGLLGLDPTAQPSRTVLMGMLAVREALDCARMQDTPAALVSGTTVGGMDRTELAYPDRLTSHLLRHHDCGSCTNDIADHFSCFDFTATVSTACSSALNAIIFGSRLIEAGEHDIVVAGGAESLSLFHLNGFKSLMILDQHRCRPFDCSRQGLNLGEGAGFLVLESEESVSRRHATPLAVLEGTGNACDAFHQTASSATGEGAGLAMAKALADARLHPADINYINAHGTGTPNNDESESAAIRRLFGSHVPPVSSTKGYTGHATSAGGSMEAVFCVQALQRQFIPRNVGWSQADDRCLTPFMGTTPPALLHHVMCNSFGFGGNDSCIIIGIAR